MRTDILVIGAGAAGMAAAVSASQAAAGRKRIAVIEKNDGPGKKIYATGNGRCNILNSSCEEAGFVRDFFRRIGLEMKEEDEGRMYPMSEQASDVVFVLEKALEAAGVEMILGTPVSTIERDGEGFVVTAEKLPEKIYAGSVIISTGGKAGPMYGSTGDGYRLARSLGHHTGRLAPALTGIETKEDMKSLKGTRAHAKVSLLKRGEPIHSEEGIVQFAEYGLSGICIFDLSRYVILDDETGFEDHEVAMDLFPDMDTEELEGLLEWRKENVQGIGAEDIMRTMVPGALAAYLTGKGGKSGQSPDISGLARRAKDLRFTASGMRGWKQAQVTRGGVLMEEIDPDSMESKFAPGLFFAGEVMDCDGPCGGYNLYNAWLTGIRAGEVAAG